MTISDRFLSNDAEFCGVCGAILPLPNNAPSNVTCNLCQNVWKVKAKRNLLMYRAEKVYERTVADTEGIDLEAADSVVDHICTKCGHTKATYATMQTRSADEGQTVFYTCVKCKKKDIEYS